MKQGHLISKTEAALLFIVYTKIDPYHYRFFLHWFTGIILLSFKVPE